MKTVEELQAELDEAAKKIKELEGGQDKETDVEKIVEERLSKELADIKTKLDKAYASRDEAQEALKKIEKEKNEALKKQLEENGNFKELLEMQKKEYEQKEAQNKQRIVELTRDNAIKDALSAIDFRNEKAAKVAFSEITSQLNEVDGKWVDKYGKDVREVVKLFVDSDDNAFLLKPKTNSGPNINGKPNVNPQTPTKKISEMTQAEVMEGIANGTIKRR